MTDKPTESTSHTPQQAAQNLSRMADAIEAWWTPRIKAHSGAKEGMVKTLAKDLRRYATIFEKSTDEQIGHDCMRLNIANIKGVISYTCASLATIAACDGSVPDLAVSGNDASQIVNRDHFKNVAAAGLETLSYLSKKNREATESLKGPGGAVRYPAMEKPMSGLTLGNMRGPYISNLTRLMRTLGKPLRITVKERPKAVDDEKTLAHLAQEVIREDDKRHNTSLLTADQTTELKNIIVGNIKGQQAVDILLNYALSKGNIENNPPELLMFWAVRAVYDQQAAIIDRKFEIAYSPERSR